MTIKHYLFTSPVLFFTLLFATPLLLADVPMPSPPTLSASGYLLSDYHSGRILAAENQDQRLEPASLTKIMTAYMVFHELKQGNLRLDDEVLVSEKAWRTPGSRMFIEVGKRVKVEDLLKGMIIQSGNDACVALAEHIAGSEATFAEIMNNHARRLGMTNSHFVNSTGLPHENHYTTPADVAKVSAATIRDFPEYYPWYKEKEFFFNDIKQHNRNRLLWRDDSVDGIKTGHTEAAGYCLVASAKRDDMRLITVVMGTKSEEARAKASQALLNYGFRFYETHRLYDDGEVVNETRIWKGAKDQLKLGVDGGLSVTIPRNQYKNLDARLSIDPKIMAPISEGTVVGHVIVNLNEKEIANEPLVALEAIDEGGLWEQLRDSVLLWLE
jgi:D-alanyl-D-alanine carboxypeptidase (penicillin-binding protein 5/6)